MRSRLKPTPSAYGDAPPPGTPERLAWLRIELERANEQFLAGRDDIHWVIRGDHGQQQIMIEWRHQPVLIGARQ